MPPSSLGSFLRSFAFGHVRQLDAISSRFLTNLNQHIPLLPTARDNAQASMIFVDVDATVIDVHSASKQGAGFGQQGSRGLNALLAAASTGDSGLPVLVRAASAYYFSAVTKAAHDAGADVSITVRMDKKVKAAIGTISDSAWTGIEYPETIYDEDSQTWISKAEVAAVPFTAFTSKKKPPHATGRLFVHRIPELSEIKRSAGEDPLLDLFRYHAFFTTVDRDRFDTVAADQVHRKHAIIEQINAELKNGALAHMPGCSTPTPLGWPSQRSLTTCCGLLPASLVDG